jgi:hypothetical protein
VPPTGRHLRVLGCPVHGEADALALRILERVLAGAAVTLDVLERSPSTFELMQLVRDRGYDVVCLADLPPAPPSRARYLVKRLRATRPDVKLFVGRWGPDAFEDEDADQTLRLAGADHVGSSTHETATELRQLASATPSGSGDVRQLQARA